MILGDETTDPGCDGVAVYCLVLYLSRSANDKELDDLPFSRLSNLIALASLSIFLATFRSSDTTDCYLSSFLRAVDLLATVDGFS